MENSNRPYLIIVIIIVTFLIINSFNQTKRIEKLEYSMGRLERKLKLLSGGKLIEHMSETGETSETKHVDASSLAQLNMLASQIP